MKTTTILPHGFGPDATESATNHHNEAAPLSHHRQTFRLPSWKARPGGGGLSWLALVLALTVQTAFSADFYWDGGTGAWSDSSRWDSVEAGVPGLHDTAIISNGVVHVDSDVVVGSLTLGGGTIINANKLTLGNTYPSTPSHWYEGTISGAGKTVIAPEELLEVNNNSTAITLSEGTLENQGSLDWIGTKDWNLTGVLTNAPGASFGIGGTADQKLNLSGYYVGRFDNAGSILMHSGHNATVYGGRFTNHTGATLSFIPGSSSTLTFYGSSFCHLGKPITVTDGSKLMIAGGGLGALVAGQIINESSGTVEFAEVLATIEPGGALLGPGIYTNWGALTLNTNVTIYRFDHAGNLQGTNTLTIENEMNWTAGNMWMNPGRAVIRPGAVLKINNSAIIGSSAWTLENRGTVEWSGSANWHFGDGATLTNAPGATVVVKGNGLSLKGYSGHRFDNAGTFRKEADSGVTTFDSPVPFYNHPGGKVIFPTGTTLEFKGLLDHQGDPIEVEPTSKLTLANASISRPIANKPGGIVEMVGAVTVQPGGALLGPGRYTNANDLTLNTNVTLAHFDLTGQLKGTNTLTILSNMNWTAGWMRQDGSYGRTVVEPGATLSVKNDAAVYLATWVLENRGLVTWDGPAGWGIINGAVLTNAPGGTFAVQGTDLILSGDGGYERIDNAGSFLKATGSGVTTVNNNLSFNNWGTNHVADGTLEVQSPYTQFAGETRLCTGSITNTSPLEITGGVIRGVGLIAGGLHVSGTATNSPGCSPGQLSVGGNYAQSAGATLEIEFDGTGNDSLSATGNVDLAGSLLIHVPQGFAPASGSSFVIAEGAAVNGGFGNLANGQRVATADRRGSFRVNYGPNSAFATNQVVLDKYVFCDVVDNAPPSLSCPPDQVVLATSTNGAVVNYTVSASDLCDPSPVVSCTPSSGSLFPMGDTTVSCWAWDVAGNTNHCSFKVMVRAIVARPEASGIVLNWSVPDVVLKEADTVSGPWSPVEGATSPWTVLPTSPRKYYRLELP